VGFIDKALEKAKADKQKKPEGQLPPEQAATAPPPLEKPPFRADSELTPGGIRYSTTRTFPVQIEELRRHRIITGNDDGSVREEYKILRTQILQRTQSEQKNTLMVTGPQPNEGKTLTAINLAISLSHEVDKTVLLVDADLRYPSVHKYFGFPTGPGLVDYLAGNAAIPELLVHPQGLDKLIIMPGGRAVAGAAELIGSPMMGKLVKELKHFYPDRYVIFDLPPVLSYADPLAFAPFVDGIIIVVEMGKTAREDIQKAVELFKGFPILGLVLNKVDNRDRECYYYCYYDSDDRAEKKKGLLGWIRS
jgi:exopolysaccharide/PEP-CTERM locus tyrosine autokinase